MKFFDTALKIEFELCEGENASFLNDFNQSAQNALLARFKKLAAKVDFSEGEALLYQMLLSIKEDLARLDDKISHKNSALVLQNESVLCGVGFEGIKFSENVLENEALYYGRVELHHQTMRFFFKALNQNEAMIERIKKEDKTAFDAFVVEIQRQNILKGKNNE